MLRGRQVPPDGYTYHVAPPTLAPTRSLCTTAHSPPAQNYNDCSMAALTMVLDTSLLAHIEYRAGGAARSAPHTNMLAKRHQQTVDLHPVLLRQHGFESQHRAFRGALRHKAPAGGYAVVRRMECNRRLLTRNAQDQVSTFGTDTAERA